MPLLRSVWLTNFEFIRPNYDLFRRQRLTRALIGRRTLYLVYCFNRITRSGVPQSQSTLNFVTNPLISAALSTFGDRPRVKIASLDASSNSSIA